MAEETQPNVTPDEGASGDSPQPSPVTVVPPPEEPKKEVEPEKEEPAEEDTEKAQKSQKEWQEMKETVKSFEKLKQAIVGEEPEVEITDTELMEKLVGKIKDLENQTKQSQWEARNPEVLAEANSEKWGKILKEKGHLVKNNELSYEELWGLVPDKQEVKHEKPDMGVPMIPRSAPKKQGLSADIVAELQKVGESLGMNWTEERILEEKAA